MLSTFTIKKSVEKEAYHIDWKLVPEKNSQARINENHVVQLLISMILYFFKPGHYLISL